MYRSRQPTDLIDVSNISAPIHNATNCGSGKTTEKVLSAWQVVKQIEWYMRARKATDVGTLPTGFFLCVSVAHVGVALQAQ